MANYPLITQLLAKEDATDDQNPRILTLFPQFFEALTVFLDYEHDLSRTESWDPAFAAWQRASDEAQGTMLELQDQILELTPCTPTEKPLKLLTFGIRLAMLDEDGEHRERFRDIVRRRGSDLLIPEVCDTDREVNVLLKRTLILFDQLLDLYTDEPVEASATL
ncbi:hypothetical protein DL1_16940 [Thioclava dalianensis]|uniref:Uncharacterized protein n=1 Tax=Thioclava dalianensis TaxID=1185766 RepID=A0A074TZV2_9RHOB|nr:hypothetical protein [Thioclava dalianensis]KEP67957.1 hypothetical protein DL1_16940 [Thioclava dalianensis]SFN92026.1 hypothetical protein SAMN05216224_1263 [Thioclava dalianensis]